MTMSQTRRVSLVQNFYNGMRQNIMQVSNVSPLVIEQSPLLKLFVVLTTSFMTYILVIFNALTHHQQSQSKQQMFICVSAIFAAFQLGLMCWLMFVIAPGVQLLLEFLASVCCNFGIILSYILGAIFPVQWCKLLPASLVAVTLGELAANDFHFNEVNFVNLCQKWVGTGVIATAPFLSPFLVACLTTVISWLCTAAGVLLVVGLRLIAISAGAWGAFIAISFICGCRHYHLNRNHVNSHSDDNQPLEPINQNEVSQCS